MRQYPDEIINRANTFHGYNTLLSCDPVPVMEFSAQPTDNTYLVGAEDDFKFENPAVNDGRSVFNEVISEYSDATNIQGEAISRNSGTYLNSVQVSNPGFEVNTTGYTALVGTITRDTVVFDSGVASCRLTSDAFGTANVAFSAALTGLSVGNYILQIRFRRKVAVTGGIYYVWYGGSSGSISTTYPTFTADIANSTINTFVSIDFPFEITPSMGANPFVYITQFALATATLLGDVGYIDNIQLLRSGTTIVDRRDFVKTALRPMTSKSSYAAAKVISDLELAAAQYPPLKGKLEISGRIRVRGGETIPVSHIPGYGVGRAILLENFNDPNTGAFGRQGVIKTASYDATTDVCTITIDDPADFITNLRARLGE